jgi:glycine oxidase
MRRDVVIVGGGVIGCSIALRLARSGLKIAVVERGRIGREASWAAAGMLSPQTEAAGPGPFFDLCLRSRALYPDWVAELKELSDVDVEYRNEGSLCISLSGEDQERAERWSAWQLEAGLPIEFVTRDALRKAEPAVTHSATGAVYVPGDHQLENRRLMASLGESLRRLDVELIEERNVDSVVIQNGRATGVLFGSERIEAAAVVVAAGCWSSQLLGAIGVAAETVPARGQMISLKGVRSPINRIIHSSRCYAIPRLDGRILIGATVEHVGFRKGVTADGIASLLTAAIEMAPELRSYEIVETWSGLRPDTADHLPILGACGLENLLLATGHFRNGILLAPVTAELIATSIETGRTPAELIPFSIDRVRSEPERSRIGGAGALGSETS